MTCSKKLSKIRRSFPTTTENVRERWKEKKRNKNEFHDLYKKYSKLSSTENLKMDKCTFQRVN